MNLDAEITTIKGIGEKTAELFNKLGVYTLGDILLFFPRTYMEYPEAIRLPIEGGLYDGEKYAIYATPLRSPSIASFSGRKVVTTAIGCQDCFVNLRWFGMPYIKNQLEAGKHYVFYGKVVLKKGRLTMDHPEIFSPENYEKICGQLRPVYNLTKGITNNAITKAVSVVLDQTDNLTEPLSTELRAKNKLCEYNYALKQMHFPDSKESLAFARKRLVYQEFFAFILSLQYHKDKTVAPPNHYQFTEDAFVEKLKEKLPFALTGAQEKALGELEEDMKGEFTMQRLVQGDVGSGKTILAFLLMAWASHSGYQSAIMAPTEVLARQHLETFTQYCKDFDLDIPLILLTGSLTAKQKREAYQRMEEERNAIIIGTHALIQEKANYSNLALVVTDEQHRFGVNQRETFAEKGLCPHIMVMSATPIPRTLALILYGDMDICLVNELPKNRLPIKNCVVSPAYRPKAYAFMEKEMAAGHQVYLICPLVEDSEEAEGQNATDYAKKMKEYFGDRYQVGLLHGRMKNEAKNKVMEDFAANRIQLLVSTTVIEVGVNVPNATLMMIEDANRFGLAQLHQLRGRVGRGKDQSYCIFMNSSHSKAAQKRLETLNHSNDGFYIASEDLKLRGPGDFFGIRQSGDFAFQLGDIYQDADLLKLAAEDTDRILKEDPELKEEKNALLRRTLLDFDQTKRSKMNL